VATRVLELVSEQTGYPPDMLELDLDLEADLGIDTVKQAEMFAAIRGEYDIERDDNLALRDYPTLARAIDFVYEKRPDLERPEGSVGGEPGAAPAAASEPVAAAVAAPEALEGSADPAVPSAGPGDSAVANKVLEIVSEQTGYPQDMLELDLDLEADLGIDTVKQAEMFAAIRGAYDIERDETLALRDYPTLARAIEFVYEKRPDLRPGAGGSGAPAGAAEAEPSSPIGEPGPGAGTAEGTQGVRGSMEAAQGIPRRVPVPRLRPSLDRFPPTGIEIGDGSRVIVVPDQGGVGAALGELLKKKGTEVLLADATQPTETLVAEVETFAATGTLTGLYWLPALDGVTDEETAGTEERREAIRRRVKNLHAVMRALYDRMGDAGTFLLSGVRLGGYHGYDEAGATDVLGGAVVGYTKAFGRERPDALVKALDFAPSRKTTALARVFLDETLRDPGAVEIGYGGDARWSVGLEERPVEPGESLGADTVYVVTGAAGSIVSAILTDLAQAAAGTYWLLDLAPEPDPANPDLARLVSDSDGLKRDLFQRMQAEGERVTPVQVEREMARLEREASAVAAIQAIEAAGGSVHYRSLDLRDTDAVASVMSEVVEAHGRVDVLVHAAGLEISRSIPSKSQEEFDLVFDVKTEGWYNLLAGLGEAPLGAAVVFSSIAGRFGNAGQVDYAAANDLLCKAVSHLRRTHPESRGVSLDWTAWRDIGMAARGSIPSIMKAAGIDMLPPEAGIPIVRRELTAGTRGEVVVAQALGVMLQEDAERTALAEGVPDEGDAARGPMTGAVKGFRLHDGLVVETTLSPGEQPFLEDHRIDGTAVLPGVMGLEAMAEAARVPFPERYVSAIEDVAFHAPFKFYRDEPRTVTVTVTYGQDGDDLVADCRLLGARQLVGREEPDVTVHFTGRVRLSPEAPSKGVRADLPGSTSEVVDAPDIYATYFHGPAYQVLKNAWRADSIVVGRFADDMPPNHSPKEHPTLTAPRLVELAFQTAGLAEIAESERMGLPHAFDRMEILRPMNGVEAQTTALVSTTGEGVFDIQVADADGEVVLLLQGYRTSALPTTVDAGAFHALKA
jgi:NAD(P)-dependent dehydrogenase (short-subunit alcohol dehydrogenase family)/acyl carrier protein